MKRELELYLHIPFCIRKCAYCDFLSGPADRQTQEQYTEALIREIKAFPEKEQYVVCSVFFGGGTPSVLPAESIVRILEVLKEEFSFLGENGEAEAESGAAVQETEVTIECNPGTADYEKLQKYRKAGINRLSLGLQSADNQELACLGRIHSWETFLETYEQARRAGFTNINIDLMSALPGQSTASWQKTLEKMLALHPEHISAYSLIIEEGTPFYEQYHEEDALREKGEVPALLPSEEEEREMYGMTEKMLNAAGMYRYEISNYAYPGYECRHNNGYWTGVWYAGFGLGASSYLNHRRYRNTDSMEQYLTASPEELQKEREVELLSQNDEMEEFMFLGLRRMAGVSEEEFRIRFQKTIGEVYGDVPGKLIQEGLLKRENGFLHLTGDGIHVSNLVMAEFLLD